MKILVAGMGALGTVYSCLLSVAGHQVTGLCRPEGREKLNKDGVKISGIWGGHAAKLEQVVSSVEELSGETFDMIIIAVKSYQTEEMAGRLAPLAAKDTYIFLLQNGYGNYEAAAKSLPADRIILSRVFFEVEFLALGESKVSVMGDDVVIGSPGGKIDEQVLERFAGLFCEAWISTQSTSEIMKYIWGKIIYDSALNALGAIFEVSCGELAEEQESRGLMAQIVTEIFTLLEARQIERFWPDAQAYLKHFYEELVPPAASHYSSMLQDIRGGRPTEIAALNGAVAHLAQQSGLNAPVNEVIAAMVRAKESLRR